MILYHPKKKQNKMMIVKGGPIYKLKMLDTDTKREIQLSKHIINSIPDWMNYFFLYNTRTLDNYFMNPDQSGEKPKFYNQNQSVACNILVTVFYFRFL